MSAVTRSAERLSSPVAEQVVDRAVAGLALVLLAPVLAVVAVLVRLDSSGPAIFRQQRVGKDGRLFWILKFRSMVVDQDPHVANVSAAGDPRVTRLGRHLRRYYLDELPQLINVVKGDMSLVGPRPETPEFVARYTEDERRVLTLRPGLVGPSTLGFMDEAERLAASSDPVACYEDVLLHERVALDLQYLTTASLRSDLVLLVRQALAILGTCRPGQAPDARRRRRRGVVLVAVAPVPVILVLSLWVDVVPNRGGTSTDFLAHTLAYALLTSWLLAFGPARLRRRPERLVLGVTALGALLELVQLAVGRDAQGADVFADMSGALVTAVGWLLAYRALDVLRKPSTPIDAGTGGGPSLGFLPGGARVSSRQGRKGAGRDPDVHN